MAELKLKIIGDLKQLKLDIQKLLKEKFKLGVDGKAERGGKDGTEGKKQTSILGDILKGATGLAESVERLHQFGDIFYSEDFLEPRPLLKAMQQEKGAILLIESRFYCRRVTEIGDVQIIGDKEVKL